MRVIIILNVSIKRKAVGTQNIFQPRVAKNFRQRNAVSWFDYKHPTNEILGLRRYFDWELYVHLKLALVETFHCLGSEWNRALKHHIEQDAE